MPMPMLARPHSSRGRRVRCSGPAAVASHAQTAPTSALSVGRTGRPHLRGAPADLPDVRGSAALTANPTFHFA